MFPVSLSQRKEVWTAEDAYAEMKGNVDKNFAIPTGM